MSGKSTSHLEMDVERARFEALQAAMQEHVGMQREGKFDVEKFTEEVLDVDLPFTERRV